MKDFEALPDISLIAHIEDHARQTPNRVALYRRVITPTSAALTLYLPLFLSSVFSILIYPRVGIVGAAISFLVALGASRQITGVFRSKTPPQDWQWEPVTYSTVATDIHTYARKLVLGGGKQNHTPYDPTLSTLCILYLAWESQNHFLSSLSSSPSFATLFLSI